LYGTTNGGGAHNKGTVFELMPGTDGKWSETVLHSFRHNGADGTYPQAGLIFDAAGNLYGTTWEGGSHDSDCTYHKFYVGCGTVFRLAPGAGGTWTETVLHSFRGNGRSSDGQVPVAGLILDAAGDLYGTTSGLSTKGAAITVNPNAGRSSG
jgi:uncharacterized repeat protein (TIGR03803 family)